jgi:hypothetical protein
VPRFCSSHKFGVVTKDDMAVIGRAFGSVPAS